MGINTSSLWSLVLWGFKILLALFKMAKNCNEVWLRIRIRIIHEEVRVKVGLRT